MTEVSQKDHWEEVYSARPTEELGWYEPHLQTSLHWIRELGLTRDAPILDVGGGASTLADDLLDEGYRCVTVLDLSGRALSLAKARLGERAKLVNWLEGDITAVDLPACHYALWHDRAVFHFLTQSEQQEQYEGRLRKALRRGGYLMIGVFAPQAPPTCSGLPVQRYGREQLARAMGPEFELKRDLEELHLTPRGKPQMYLYCLFRRSEGDVSDE